MSKNILKKSAYEVAFSSWFSEYELERKRRRRRRGSVLIGFPEPPVDPNEIEQAVHEVGKKRVLTVFKIHRTTLKRWLSGEAVMPRCAWLLLAIMRDGIIPGMSSDWKHFRFDGDRLCLVGTNIGYTAREISGWQYQIALIKALQRRVADLERDNAHLVRVGDFGAANDELIAI